MLARGKELTEVKEFAEAHSRAQAEREAAFSRFLNGKQVAGELRDWCRGESTLDVYTSSAYYYGEKLS